MTDYKSLYQGKVAECEQLNKVYNELDQQSSMIINDLEEDIKSLKRKNQTLTREINQQKEKSKCFKSSIEREVELAQKERNQFKKKFMQFEKKVIQLEIMNESLEAELRATKSLLSEYEARTEKTMQELTVVQLQLEETHSNNQEIVARLKGQLKETEEELFALHQTRERINEGRQTEMAASSQITSTNSSVFKQTLKQIREYLGTLDNRKLQLRKTLLKG